MLAEELRAVEGRVLEQAHGQAVVAPVGGAASFLQELLGRRPIAYVAGVKGADTVSRWASGEVGSIRQESEQRVRTAYEVAQVLVRFDPPRIVKEWFVGLDPQLDGVSPAEAIREGKPEEARAAALAFVADS